MSRFMRLKGPQKTGTYKFYIETHYKQSKQEYFESIKRKARYHIKDSFIR